MVNIINIPVIDEIQKNFGINIELTETNLIWLQTKMHPYFFSSNSDDVEAVTVLTSNLHFLEHNRRFTLADSNNSLIIAQLGVDGTIHDSLRSLPERSISYAQIHTSYGNVPKTDYPLEILEFYFSNSACLTPTTTTADVLPTELVQAVQEEAGARYRDFPVDEVPKMLSLIWQNNPKYVRTSPPVRIARLLQLFSKCRSLGGISLSMEKAKGIDMPESRILFGVANPPDRKFLLQIFDAFRRLRLRVHRCYCLTIHDGEYPYFLSTFYATTENGGLIAEDGALFQKLRAEMYTTQVMPMTSLTYDHMIASGIVGGPDGSLIRAFIGFCHTNLSHTHPDSFDLEGVARAFHHHQEISLQLVKLFHARFDPEAEIKYYPAILAETKILVENFNTGRRFLDEFRRNIFRCCLLMVRYTVKTNFFIPEKRTLAFRLDPAYLEELGGDFINDLPADRPFRITYFSSRYGTAYHIGFADIARGGWRTVITQGRDDYVTAANSMFRETYVLAHTQHLKNKDIYEGGSKLVAVLKAEEGIDAERLRQQLYFLQHAIISGFLDLFVTRGGRAADPRIVDYYGEDEPIELGPDENMHDQMIELVAREAVGRGYMLGSGIMSSKRVGINHKEYGVTSRGVVRFAEVCMENIGLNMTHDPCRVIFTGGPNGDVAGNCMKILLKRYKQVCIPLIVDGTAAVHDPQGLDHAALKAIILKDDLSAFDPTVLHIGGFMFYRTGTRRQGMQELFKKVIRTPEGLVESWISNDEFYKEYNSLIFQVSADLFIPAGGRPETVDGSNWQRFFDESGTPRCRVIVEGANSFITPEARRSLQKRGVILMRDASANKCGVIASSYEIIANLLLSDEEFLAHKEEYVADVLEILEKRAEEEARVIFARHREASETLVYSEISDKISAEINSCYARLFEYFRTHPEICERPIYRRAILDHLPKMLARKDSPFRERIERLPNKIKYAILAGEIASSMMYHTDRDQAFLESVEGHLRRRQNLDHDSE